MVQVSASWVCVTLFNSFAVAVVFKHGAEQVPSSSTNSQQYADLMGDMMKDVSEITAKETLDHVSDELKREVSQDSTHVTSNDATNPFQWMKGLMKNVIGRTEDTLEDKVLQSAQNAFDQQVDRNGNLINPSEEYSHPDPSTRRSPQMPGVDWSRSQNIPPIPKVATGIFAPKSYLQTSSDDVDGQKKMKGNPLKDVMSDVAADLNDLAQIGVYEKVKGSVENGIDKDYDSDIAAKKEDLGSAKKWSFDWLKKLGGVAKATAADRINDSAKARAQKIFDSQVTEDGTAKQGTWIDRIAKILGSPLKKKEIPSTSEPASEP
eukprot:gnl/MRDRNA2_/MRDRNA2_95848_c0_seq1.p1 gnl/MRDRNA2_/MRDRNA2_95848_c0~~gnl/MRDRNA2_/MRDRNA2_95848_c0_seq1.p1  ORF type:complete len:320 (-),score=77.41 gnl/MRDRNA2_/MRDRNA2_95848_c0_seq1:52-1011(-)